MPTNPFTMRLTRLAHVAVIGEIWWPIGVLYAMSYPLSDYDLENIGKFTRKNMETWVDTHTGDFSSVLDFAAVCGDTEIPWRDEASGCRYDDCMYPEENE